MKGRFFKRNWLYVLLLGMIVLLNVLSRFEEGRKSDEDAITKTENQRPEGAPRGPERGEGSEIGGTPKTEKKPTLFVEFEEAGERSEKIEKLLKGNAPLHLFYIAANLSVVFIFFAGLFIDGFFISRKLKKREVFLRSDPGPPVLWEIADIFRVIILAIAFSYVFFIAFGLAIKAAESFFKIKFEFYKSDNFRMIFDTLVLDFILLFVILRFLRDIYGRKLTALGFTGKNLMRNILYGICGYAGIIPVILLMGVFIYFILNIFGIRPPPQPIVELFLAEKNVTLVFASSFIAALIGPVIEEIFFRGVMYNAIKRKIGIFRAIFITSVLFSFLHTHAMTYFLVGFIPITILGVVLAYLYEKTGSLIPSITLHVLNNAGSVVMVFLFKYFNGLAG